jgi:hypothetical protein
LSSSVFTALIPVGPSTTDVRRLDQLLASLAQWEDPAQTQVVVVDDGPQPRPLRPAAPFAAFDVIRTPLWARRIPPDPYSAMVAGTIEGLRAAHPTTEFVVKLDTDALVIAPFRAKLGRAFGHDPALGVVGSYDVTCTGGRRDWSRWEQVIAAAPKRWRATRVGGRPRIWFKSRAAAASCRRVLALAREHGYVTGAHCLGGAYAVGPALLQRRDLLEWSPWIRTHLGEDVVVGVLAAAAGLRSMSLVGPDEPFGLAHVGLPESPEWLVGRGHSIVHSVKDDDAQTEAALRARLASGAGGRADL